LLSKNKNYYYDHEAIMQKSKTFENRPSGVERNRIHGYSSKENLNPQAYLKNIKGNMSAEGVTRTTAGLNLKTQQDKTKEERNKRSVWTVTTKPFSEAHFATFPEDLIMDCIKAGCPEGGIILDPFMGAFTTALMARKFYRNYIGYEINPEYIAIGEKRLSQELGMFR
jgi:DNA modification methylase